MSDLCESERNSRLETLLRVIVDPSCDDFNWAIQEAQVLLGYVTEVAKKPRQLCKGKRAKLKRGWKPKP